MHFPSSASATMALFAALTPLAQAEISLKFAPSNGLIVDHEYNITWTSDTNYTTWMNLVQQTRDGWTPVDEVIGNQYTPSGEQTINFWVPNVPSDEQYAIYIYGEDPLTMGDGSGRGTDADLTDWFLITGGYPRRTGLNKAQIAGLAVGIVISVMLAAVAAFFLVRRLRARRAEVAGVVESSPPPAYPMEEQRQRISEDSIESQKEKVRLVSK